MAAHESNSQRSPVSRDRFATTHWSIVVCAAGRCGKPESSRASEADRAMAELCRVYWYPLYAYVRRRGYDTHQAEDLTQEFFFRLLDKNYLAEVDRRRGKFRSFLLASLKHFLANEWDRSQAQKRGGRQVIISLDTGEKRGQSPFAGTALRVLRTNGDCPLFPPDAESRYRLEPFHDLTPEKLFERQWALMVLEQVLARLQAEFADDGKQALFDGLKRFLTGDRVAEKGTGPICAKHPEGRSGKLDLSPFSPPTAAGGHAQAAAELGMTTGAVKVAVHRLRRRYRQLLWDEISQTVATPEEIDDEIRHLLACLE